MSLHPALWISVCALSASFALRAGCRAEHGSSNIAPAPVASRSNGPVPVGTESAPLPPSSSAQPHNAGASKEPRAIALPAGEPGIGFDDLRFAPVLGRVLIPAGRSGNVDLIDPKTFAVTSIAGFSTSATADGGHDFGVTSADEGPGVVFATDRTSRQLVIVDPARRAIVSKTPLSSGPDYVRWIPSTKQIWVTEPDAEKIEVFGWSDNKAAAQGAISVPGGPESLIVDAASGKAYSNLWHGQTVSIDVATHKVGPAWSNGCTGSRGIDVDPARGLVFVGCAEGAVSVLSMKTGAKLSQISAGAGMDIIAYDAKRSHVYAPGARAATLSIIDVAGNGASLSVLATMSAASGAHCAATDGLGHVYVCDPHHGRILEFEDSF